jgi:hypothetical protein
MKHIILISLSLFALNANADIYKCIDASGSKVYRSTPCAEGSSNIQIDLKTGKTVDLDEEKRAQLLKLKEQQELIDRKKLEDEQENLRKLQVINQSKKNQLLIKNNPSQFSAFAIPPYDPDNLNSLVKKFEDKLEAIEKMRALAAQKALASDQCSRVESSELNEKSSKDSLVFLVDCSNAKSYYFNESELAE